MPRGCFAMLGGHLQQNKQQKYVFTIHSSIYSLIKCYFLSLLGTEGKGRDRNESIYQTYTEHLLHIIIVCLLRVITWILVT